MSDYKTLTVMGREYTYVGTSDEGDERWQWNRYAINLWHRVDGSWQALASVSGCELASISVFGFGATAEDALRDMLRTLKTITAQREALGALVAGALDAGEVAA